MLDLIGYVAVRIEVNIVEIYLGGESTRPNETMNLGRRKVQDYSQVSCSGRQPL